MEKFVVYGPAPLSKSVKGEIIAYVADTAPFEGAYYDALKRGATLLVTSTTPELVDWIVRHYAFYEGLCDTARIALLMSDGSIVNLPSLMTHERQWGR